jgi:hypothetical protein
MAAGLGARPASRRWRSAPGMSPTWRHGSATHLTPQ